MIDRRGSNLTIIILLLTCLLMISHAVFASAPVVTGAQYLDAENILEITLDQPVYNDSLNVIRGGITLDGDNGGANVDLTLTGGSISGPEALSAVIQIKLKYLDQKAIETMIDRNTLELELAKNVFINAGKTGNDPITFADNVPVQFIEDVEAPQVLNAKYDAGTNVLTIELDRSVNGRQADLTKISIDDDNGGPKENVAFNSLRERVTTQKTATVMEISLNPTHQQAIENMDTKNLNVIVRAFAFINDKRNSQVPGTTAISFSSDNSPLNLLSADYDAIKNNLTLKFNEKVITTFWEQPAINYKGMAIRDLEDAAQIAVLSGSAAVSVKSDTAIVINVLPADQRLIENLKNKDKLYITIDAFAILDAAGNGIRSYSQDDKIVMDYNEEKEENAPSVAAASYNAGTNVLKIVFGRITAQTKGIDTTNVDLTGVMLDDDTGSPSTNVTLSGGRVKGIKSGVPKFVRELDIIVNSADEAKIESLTRKDNISIAIKALSFFYESYTNTRNGNHELKMDSIKVVYSTDTMAPEVEFAKYDFQENQLNIQVNKLIRLSAFSPDKISFGGVRLSGGEIVEKDISSTITIKISPADQARIKALENSVKQDPVLLIDQGALANLDGSGNAALSIRDGDVTSTVKTITIGYGRGYWDRSFEAFETDDKFIETSLRGVGEHCYVFVADSEWRENVTKDVVANVINAFDKSTPADAGKGIYQLCRDVFGTERDTDKDPRIHIVFLNLRDEYGVGRNDRYADLPKAGYFDVRDLPATAQDPHSNLADIIYVDTDPIVSAGTYYNVIADNFQRMIHHHVDVSEERWLVEGFSAIAQVICGYGFSDYKIPASLPTIPFKTTLTLWTGWLAGEPSDLSDLHNVFLFTLYLYEQFGGVELIKDLAAEKTNGLESVQKVLKANFVNTPLSKIYDDFAVACLKDQLDHPVYGNKYGFKATNTQLPGMGNINWDRDEIWDTENQWSFNFYKMKAKDIPKTFLFNGNDQSDFSIQFMEASGNFTVDSVEVDTINRLAKVDLSKYTQDINIIVCSKSSNGPVPSPYILSRDAESPQRVTVGIFQNPSVQRNVDVYIVSEERLFMDLPFTDPELSGTVGEGPEVALKLGKTTTTLIAEASFSDSMQTMFQYRARFNLLENGNYTVTVKGKDMTGNLITPLSNTITVKKMLASQGGSIMAGQHVAELSITPDGLHDDTIITGVVLPDETDAVICRIGPGNCTLRTPAQLKVYYDRSASKLPAVYQKTGSGWQLCDAQVDLKNNALQISVQRLGDFRIQYNGSAMDIPALVPKSFAIAQNYPNPFNASTRIEYQIPQPVHVKLVVYNMIGQKVATLVDQPHSAGFYTLNWDTQEISSGVYYYVFHAGRFSRTQKMLLIR